jgi:hypothetical protein
MIAAHNTTGEPYAIRIGGCEWRVSFNLWALRKLEERFAPNGEGLEGTQLGQMELAAGQVDAAAVFLWAGLLWDDQGITIDDALALLDEAAPAELAEIPGQLLEALRRAVPDKVSDEDGDGAPFDWEMALAVWVSEWGRSEPEFWQTTLRTFGSISNGRARLYKTATSASGSASAGGYDEMDLDELMSARRGR